MAIKEAAAGNVEVLGEARADAVEGGGGRVAGNVLALGTGQLVTWTASSVLAIALPHYLGDRQLGQISLAFSITELCGLLASLGTGTYVTKEVARRGKAAGGTVATALLLRVPLVLLTIVAALLASVLLQLDHETRMLLYLFVPYIALSAAFGIVSGALMGLQIMRPIAVSNAVSKTLLVGCILAAAYFDLGAAGIAVAWDISMVAALAVVTVALVREGIPMRAGSRAGAKAVLAGGLPFFVWQSSFLVYARIDVILLSIWASEAVLGWYDAAYRIISIPVFIPVIITAATFPRLSQLAIADMERFRDVARRSLNFVLLLTVPIAAGLIVLAGDIIDFLGYPSEFEHSIPLIMILALHIPLVGADMVVGNALSASSRQRAWALAAVAAAVLNPALNTVLIAPTESAFSNGAIGAATATVVTELFLMMCGLRLLERGTFTVHDLAFAMKCVAAATLMGALVWAMPAVSLPLRVVAGAGVYLAASLVLRTVSTDDIHFVHSYLLSRIMPRRTVLGEWP